MNKTNIWNRGLTKETDIRVKKCADKARLTFSKINIFFYKKFVNWLTDEQNMMPNSIGTVFLIRKNALPKSLPIYAFKFVQIWLNMVNKLWFILLFASNLIVLYHI